MGFILIAGTFPACFRGTSGAGGGRRAGHSRMSRAEGRSTLIRALEDHGVHLCVTSGLAQVIQAQDVKPQEVMAFGDAMNDYEVHAA